MKTTNRKGPRRWTWGTFIIRGSDGDTVVSGIRKGLFAIDERDGFPITHLPTGYRVTVATSLNKAVQIANEIALLKGWERVERGDLSKTRIGKATKKIILSHGGVT